MGERILISVVYRWWHSSTSRCRRQNTSTQCVPPTSYSLPQQATSCRTGISVRGWWRFWARLWIVCYFYKCVFMYHWKVVHNFCCIDVTTIAEVCQLVEFESQAGDG